MQLRISNKINKIVAELISFKFYCHSLDGNCLTFYWTINCCNWCSMDENEMISFLFFPFSIVVEIFFPNVFNQSPGASNVYGIRYFFYLQLNSSNEKFTQTSITKWRNKMLLLLSGEMIVCNSTVHVHSLKSFPFFFFQNIIFDVSENLKSKYQFMVRSPLKQ